MYAEVLRQSREGLGETMLFNDSSRGLMLEKDRSNMSLVSVLLFTTSAWVRPSAS